MNSNLNFILTMLILIMVGVFMPMLIRSIIWNRFLKAMENKDVDKAKAVLDSKAYRMMFDENERIKNKLNLALATSNRNEVNDYLNQIIYGKYSKSFKSQMIVKTYYFYLELEDKDKTKRLLEEIKKFDSNQDLENMEMLYRILIEKKSEDIEYFKNRLEDEKEELSKVKNKHQLGLLQYYLGLQYYYLKDNKEANKWLGKAKENLKGTAYHKKIKAMIK